MLTSMARRPAVQPVNMVAFTGVPRVGWMRPKKGGSRPSRDMVM